MTLDDVVAHPQYRMRHSRIVDAPPTAVWDELCRVTMSALPVGYALEGIRLLPARLAGRKHQSLAGRTFLDVTPIPVLFSERPQVVISAGLSQALASAGRADATSSGRCGPACVVATRLDQGRHGVPLRTHPSRHAAEHRDPHPGDGPGDPTILRRLLVPHPSKQQHDPP